MLNIMLMNLKNMALLTGTKNNLTLFIRVYILKLTGSIHLHLGIVTVLLEFID